jgi:hypothetical protein
MKSMYRVTIDAGTANKEIVVVRASSHEEAKKIALDVTKINPDLVRWVLTSPL